MATDRPYAVLTEQLRALTGDREARLQAAVDLMWQHLAGTGVSWVGFYYCAGGDELTLGPCRDRPACSPIGMHGACGQAFRSGKALVVRDVADLGDNYVACDPRDRSEVVVPLFDPDGSAWGVLDLDSFGVGSFTDADADALREAMQAAGISAGQ